MVPLVYYTNPSISIAALCFSQLTFLVSQNNLFAVQKPQILVACPEMKAPDPSFRLDEFTPISTLPFLLLVPVQIFALLAVLGRTPASRSQIAWLHIRSRTRACLWMSVHCISLGIQLHQGLLLARFMTEFVSLYWSWSLSLHCPWWLWSLALTSGVLLLWVLVFLLAWGIFVAVILCLMVGELAKWQDLGERAKGLAIK